MANLVANKSIRKTFQTEMVLFLIFATLSLVIGIFINQFRDMPLALNYHTKEERLGKTIVRLASDTQRLPSQRLLSTKLPFVEFAKYVEQKQGLIVDARPEIFYRLGHVPGALNLPRDDFENAYRLLREKLERNKSQPIVIYCANNSCEDGGLVQNALANLGYTQLALFEGGWDVWTGAGKPKQKNQ